MKKFSGLFLVFGIVGLLCFSFKDQLNNWQIDYRVVFGANALLLFLGVVSLLLHIRALANPNPQAFIRSVMLANIIKILVLAISAFTYIQVAGKATSTRAVFAGLFLYIIYTWVEKRATIQLSRSKQN
jgi:small-conductance mechanosensitive channel